MALPELATRFSQAGANVGSFAALLPDGTVPGDLILVFTPYGTNRDLMVLGTAAWDHWGRVTVGGVYVDCWYHVVDEMDRFDGVDDSVTLSVSVQMALAALVVRVRGVTDPVRVLGSMVAFTDSAPSVAYPTLEAGTARLRRWCWFWFGEYGCLPVSHSVDLPDDRVAVNSSGGQVSGSFVFATAAATASSFTPADGSATGTNAVGGFGFCFDEDAGVPLAMPTVRIRVTTSGDTNPANLVIAMPEGSDVPGTILVCIAAYDWGNISDPATPAGWTRFAFLNNISGTSEDFAAWYRVVDGSEGFDGTDDTVVFSGGWTQAASHTVFAVHGDYPLADLLASFTYGTRAYAGSGYAARPLDLGTAKRRLWFHGLSTRYGGRSANRGDPTYLHRRFRTFRGARQSQVLIATHAQASASTPAPFVATNDGTAVTWAFAIESQDLVFAPPGFGAEVGIAPGLTLVIGAGRMLLPSPRFGVAVGVASGLRFDVEGPRQVMLAGGPETSALTEGGTEGHVLTYHARRKPTWEAASGGGLTVAEADGTPDVAGVTRLELVGASLTDDGGGQVTISVNAGGVSYGGDTDISTLAYEDEPAAGVLDAVARADHVHGMPVGGSARQDNLAASVDPTATDDASTGYAVGSLWINTTDDRVFRCVDDTAGAAVWLITSVSRTRLLSYPVGGGNPATVAIPDADIPRVGGALFDDGGDTGVGIIHWYRQGTYNRVTGVDAPSSPWVFREATYSASDPFSFYIEANTAGARLMLRNSAGYGRTVSLWVFTAEGNLA